MEDYRNNRDRWTNPDSYKKVSMGLTDRRKTAKNLVDSRKNWKILTVQLKRKENIMGLQEHKSP